MVLARFHNSPVPEPVNHKIFMNRQDVEMLQQSLQNLGQGALQRRELELNHQRQMQQIALEQQMRELQEKRYDAYIGHNQTMEDRLQNANEANERRNQILAQTEDDKVKIFEQGKQAAQDFAEAKDNMAQFTQTLRANRLLNQKDPTKGLSQAEAAKTFQQAMDGLPQSLHDQMLQNPQYSTLYKGGIDFGSLPALDAKGNPVTPAGDPQLTTLKDPNNPGATATGVQDSHGNWHPLPPPPGLPQKANLVAGTIKENLPANNSPTNAPYAAGQFDALMQPGGGSPQGVSTPTPTISTVSANGIPTGKPDPRDIQWLTTNPTPQRISTFEGQYGKGSSSQFLTPPPASQ